MCHNCQEKLEKGRCLSNNGKTVEATRSSVMVATGTAGALVTVGILGTLAAKTILAILEVTQGIVQVIVEVSMSKSN